MIPTLNDMLAMGVPETAAKAWCEGIDKLRHDLALARGQREKSDAHANALQEKLDAVTNSARGRLQSVIRA